MKTWFGKFVARKVCASGRGNQAACNKLFIKRASLYASVSRFNFLEADEDEDHPNKMPFEGTLVILDEPSDKPPHGSQGHRILVPKQVAQENLKSLVGQGLNYSPELDEHAPRRKVGVITDAWIAANKVKVKGWVWKKDFPEAERDLKQGRLGMSMELANVYVRDENADVWYLEDFVFTGATVLHRDAAAYTKTQLAASAAATSGKGEKMPKTQEKKKMAAAAGEKEGEQARLFAAALGTELEKRLTPFTTAINKLTGEMGEVKELITVQAAAQQEADEDEDVIQAAGKHDDDDMEARGKHEEDDDEEMDAAHDEEDDEDAAADRHAKKDDEEDDDETDDSEDDDDEDDLDASLEDLEEKPAFREPGEVNKGMEKKGSKTTVTKVGAARVGGKPFPKLVKASRGMSASAALMVREVLASRDRKWQRTVRDIQAQADKKVRKMRGRLDAMQAQVEKFAELENRRSLVPVELANLAAKSNLDLQAMRSDGVKMTTEQVDSMMAAAGVDLGPTERIAMKNRLLEQGLMDEGRIERPYNQRLN